jgi:hypothetical protein
MMAEDSKLAKFVEAVTMPIGGVIGNKCAIAIFAAQGASLEIVGSIFGTMLGMLGSMIVMHVISKISPSIDFDLEFDGETVVGLLLASVIIGLYLWLAFSPALSPHSEIVSKMSFAVRFSLGIGFVYYCTRIGILETIWVLFLVGLFALMSRGYNQTYLNAYIESFSHFWMLLGACGLVMSLYDLFGYIGDRS